jgi:hypothetical protein
MKVAVWDTYVKRKDGLTMHFDIIVPQELKEEKQIYEFGKRYLQNKDVLTEQLSSKECNYCHIEEASDSVLNDIKSKGFHIVELKNCL